MSKKIMAEDTTPIRVFAGTNLNKEALRHMGRDPDMIRTERAKMQKEMSANSKNGKTIFLDGGHFTIFTKKESADLICKEIFEFMTELE